MAQRVILSVTNDLGNDQRVHRVAISLQEMGFEVCLVGRLRRHSMPLEPRPYATKRIRYRIESGKLFYIAYAFRMFWWLLFQRVDVLLANDMDTLLPNFLVAKLRRKKLVYDSHEYWAEVPELIGRRATRAVWLWLERRLFPRVDAAYTVNQSIAQIYSSQYGLPVGVVRNLPRRRSIPASTIPKAQVLIYQGALNIGRGIELMIEAMRYLADYQLIIAGYGTIEEPLRGLAAAAPYPARIQFTGFLPPDQLQSLTLQAKLGMSLEADRGESYRLALPNKLFDYVQAGIPVLVSDLPEMAAIVHNFGVGEVLLANERQPQLLAARIRAICEDAEKYGAYVRACEQAAQVLTWEHESASLKAIFAPFLK